MNPPRQSSSHAAVARFAWIRPLLLALALGGAAWAQSAEPLPAFRIAYADGQERNYTPDSAAADRATFGDDRLEAEMVRSAPDQFELRLTARFPIASVLFPWEAEMNELDRSTAAEMLYPYLLGVARRTADQGEWAWQGVTYPGPLFAPLAIITTGRSARMVAATNWPPRRVHVLHSRGRLLLRYEEPIARGESRSFGAIIARATGDAAAGDPPWHKLADRYREWLLPRMAEAGLRFDHQPDWMKPANGFLNIQLENMTYFDPEWVRAVWRRWRGDLPWVIFWGQMSHYAGPAQYARPPRAPNEETGCCLPEPRIHPRYLPGLPRVAAEIVSTGGRVGYYVRPRPPPAPLTDASHRSFLLDWMAMHQRELSATTHYIDTLCGHDFGPPLEVARQVAEMRDVLIEFAVDVYPAPGLLSGCLSGGDVQGGPGRTALEHGQTTFPALGRYLLRERAMVIGESNGDHRFWGARNEHWAERQAFLLGCKLDVQSPAEGDPIGGAENRAMRRIFDLWRQTDWWSRAPRYVDRRGISEVSLGVDVRRFTTNTSDHLLVIDNWRRRRGASFVIDGWRVDVPEDPLSILIWRPR